MTVAFSFSHLTILATSDASKEALPVNMRSAVAQVIADKITRPGGTDYPNAADIDQDKAGALTSYIPPS